MGVVHCLYKREDWTSNLEVIKMRTWLDSVLLLALFSVGNQILCGVIQEQLPREARTLDINSNSTSDFLDDLSSLLQGAAAFFRTVAETKKDTVLPIVESVVEAKTSLINSDTVKSVVAAKTGVVRSLVETAPQLAQAAGSVTGALVETAEPLIKGALCTVVCPVIGEQCKKDHCDEEDSDSS